VNSASFCIVTVQHQLKPTDTVGFAALVPRRQSAAIRRAWHAEGGEGLVLFIAFENGMSCSYGFGQVRWIRHFFILSDWVGVSLRLTFDAGRHSMAN